MDQSSLVLSMTGLMLSAAPFRLNANDKNARGPVIVEAGRRVDKSDADIRFPPRNVPLVRERIRRVLTRKKPVATVSSGACGADLLLLDVARELSIPRYILLPSKPEEFRESSVTDRPGNWGELYSEALRTSAVEVLELPKGEEGYLETNLRLLDRAQALAVREHTTVETLVVWNLEPRKEGVDLTAHFLKQANTRGISIATISTL